MIESVSLMIIEEKYLWLRFCLVESNRRRKNVHTLFLIFLLFFFTYFIKEHCVSHAEKKKNHSQPRISGPVWVRIKMQSVRMKVKETAWTWLKQLLYMKVPIELEFRKTFFSIVDAWDMSVRKSELFSNSSFTCILTLYIITRTVVAVAF